MHGHMKKYDCLIDDIHYELKAAHHYAKKAAMYKTEDKPLSALYYELAHQEMNHAIMLKEHVPKVVMMHESLPIIWERDHEHIIDWMAEVKHTLEMSRE